MVVGGGLGGRGGRMVAVFAVVFESGALCSYSHWKSNRQ